MQRLATFMIVCWFVASGAATAQTSPVVVELYTSQGCSSCPPADAFLHENLADRDDVIALALHVDYWDYLGWKDHFASPQYTKRQKAYARAAGQRTVYTPQMIIAGQDHVVGNKPDAVHKLINKRKRAGQVIELELERKGGTLEIEAENLKPSKRATVDVYLVRYVRAKDVHIKRGENAGRTLTYGNIVTDWRQVVMWDMDQPISLKVPVQGKEPIVVIVQREGNGEIVAAQRLP